MKRWLWQQDRTSTNLFELHTFCDASIKAYGCEIYWVAKSKIEKSCSTLVFAKNRVAPLIMGKDVQKEPSTTIPRLEF